MRIEVRIAGFGGQGIGLAGYILGKAIALFEGLEAVMTQAYGPEARGGASSSSIVISDQEIAYPFIEHPDYLIALSQEAYNRFHPSISQDGIIIIEQDLVEPTYQESHFSIPATRLADDLGVRIAANMVMLGFFSRISGIVSQPALIKSVESSVPTRTLNLNLRALQAGFEFAPTQEINR